MDYNGLTIGFYSFFAVSIFVFLLLQKHDLNRRGILVLVALSAIGHFLGGYAYHWFATHNGADSIFYFENATTNFEGMGYHFAFYILGYLRLYFLGNSFLGAFLLSAAFGFLGSIFYLLTFKVLLDKVSDGHPFYLTDPKLLFIPALLLLCWPSYFFWSAGLIKDNFAFLSIGMFLFCVAKTRLSLPNLALLALAAMMGFLIRPYLFITVGVSTVLFVLFGSKWNMLIKMFFLGLIGFALLLVLPQLNDYAAMVHFSGISFAEMASFALHQQSLMNIGSSIPVPTHNPNILFFFLPYLILANLFLPLFIGAGNLIGLVGSIENACLLWWTVFLLKNKPVWSQLNNKMKIARFFIIYFFVGMSFLSIVNTNLGLAMREKMMYVPALLIVIFLVYAYRRILFLQSLSCQES